MSRLHRARRQLREMLADYARDRGMRVPASRAHAAAE
jgi:RNA polymerase sigma-70 factor (ECF subfamily)